MMKRWVILSLLLCSTSTLAQSTQPSIQNESNLSAALCSPGQTKQAREALLMSHSGLVTTQLWDDLNTKAAAAYYEISPEQSLAIYEIALQVAKQINNPKLLATTYYNIGRTYSGANQLTQAVEAYLSSQREFERAGLHHDLIYIFSDLSSLYFNLEDYQKAKDYSEQVINLADKLKTTDTTSGSWPDEYGVAGALSTLSELSLREGDQAQAIKYMLRSLALYKQLNARDHSYDLFIADGYAALGRIYTETGDYSQALLNLKVAYEMMRNLPVPDLNRMSSLLTNIGYLYLEQEDYAQATENFNRSLQGFLRLDNQREAALVLLNLGVIEQRQEHYDSALEYFKKSLQKATATSNKGVMIPAGEGIGVVLKAKGNVRKAIEIWNQSLVLARETGDQTRQAELLWRMAESYCLMGDSVQGEELARKSVKLARDLHLPKLVYLATTTLGQSYILQNKPQIALETLAQAVQQIESLREQVAGQKEEVQLFFENKVAPYDLLIELLVNQNKLLDALLYGERAKGRVLLDVFSGDKVDLDSVLTPDEREKVKSLNRVILGINERIRNEQSNASVNATLLKKLYSDLDVARFQYESYQNTLYASHPELNVRRGQTSVLNSESLNNLMLDDKTAYLEYVVTSDQVFLFVLTRKSINVKPELKVYSIKIRADELSRKVNQFHRLISERHPVFAGSAHELYDLLVKPASKQLSGISTLCIIPDASLWDVPFQALLSENDRYLLEDYAMYYAPSLSVLQEMSPHTGANAMQTRGSLIAFGNPLVSSPGNSKSQANSSDKDLCPLPEAETEVATLGQIYGSSDSKVFIGHEASEKTFKQLAPGYRTLHLATHGVLDNRHPLYSYLLLTKSESDSENDGLLEAREIMNMNLHADLAVLSACETARGRIGAGEGVIGMSWAFFVAGVRTMVVSQWKVNSASTSQLMVNFYKALKPTNSQDKETKATSLRTAAISLMRDQRFRHPFYWAGFVMVGSNE